MAAKKKFVKYEIQTATSYGSEYRLMDGYTDLGRLLDMHEATIAASGETWNRFGGTRLAYHEGRVKDLGDLAEWNQRMLKRSAYCSSPEFDEMNAKVMAEYHSREDLQEMYRLCVADQYWVYDRYGKHINITAEGNEHMLQNPVDYIMFMCAANSTKATNMREKNRDTGFQEGDLVLLRKPYVGNRDIDPLWVNPYSHAGQDGATTPDASFPRIGTVIAVTDELSREWRAAKGSRVLKILWMGKEDIENVELRYIKWHERPTKKNGLLK